LFVKTGFTLAELLISLAVLGVIAAFTIPKLLNVVGDGPKKYAIFKEIITSIEAVGYQLVYSGEGVNTDFRSLIASKLNAVSYNTSSGILKLPNQADIRIGYNGGCGTGLADINIDYNGANTSPNLPGEDVFCGRMILGSSGGCGGSDYRGAAPPGRLYVSGNCKAFNTNGTTIPNADPYGWPGTQMYQDIFK
jgi:prepilin-type N-terminal cleavage/methylation domain-containing protein